MRRRILVALLVAGLAGAARGAPPPAPGTPAVIDWPLFLARQDLVWSHVPASWSEAPFIGNGDLGATIYLQGAGLGWEVNRTDVTDGGSRYPMGQVALQPAGGIVGGNARLDLWNAEARGTLRTRRGEIHWRSFVAASPSVIAIEWEGTGGEMMNTDVVWLPTLARPPRVAYQIRQWAGHPHPAGAAGPFYAPDDLQPPPEIVNGVGLVTGTQEFRHGGAFAVALLRGPSAAGRKFYYVSVGRGPSADAALAEATASVERAAEIGFDALDAAHRAWWHAYYPASFLSVPDARLEAFYWIQIYKLGSAMRPDGPILDLMGPWFRDTPWPRIWWNLNAQLTYSPLFTANRLPLAASLFNALDRHRPQLIDNVPPAWRATAAAIGRSSDQSLVAPVHFGGAGGPAHSAEHEAGNLPWVMYLYWEYYRYQMDDGILRNRVLPLLGRAVGYYLDAVQKGPDGRYHLPPTFSPELATVRDANYDLALLRWGLQTLIASDEHLRLNDPRLPRWREVLSHLTPFPTDASGLMVGADYPLRVSHRHYSHLLAIYPLHLLDPDRPADRRLIETSLHNWDSRPAGFRGFSYAGAAAMYALLGQGDTALARLETLLNRFIHPNTFYTEAGPVIETPLSAAASLQDMLLQSWGGKLRVFPAVPRAWPDAAFADLRGEGAFLVGAQRRHGRTAWVRVESLAGGPCRLVVPGWTAAVARGSGWVIPAPHGSAPALPPSAVTALERGEFDVALPKGAWVLLGPEANSLLPPLAPSPRPPNEANPYATPVKVKAPAAH